MRGQGETWGIVQDTQDIEGGNGETWDKGKKETWDKGKKETWDKGKKDTRQGERGHRKRTIKDKEGSRV